MVLTLKEGFLTMKRRILVALTLILTLMLVACGGSKTKKVVLPNLDNQTKSQALVKLDEAGIDFVLSDEVNNKIREGIFSRYDGFKAGDEIEKGEKITVLFAIHKNVLPDLTGLTYEEIQLEFGYVNFTVTYEEVETDEVANETFYKYEGHSAGVELPDGTRVKVLIGITPFPEKNQMLISKYYEGKGDNKAIELYNGSNMDISLKDFSVGIHGTSGSLEPTTRIVFNDNEVIKAKSTYVIVDGSDEALKAKANLITELPYTGRQTISLFYKDQAIDAMGYLDTGNIKDMIDVSFIRREEIEENTIHYSSAQWDEYIPDLYDKLGTHPVKFPETFTLLPEHLARDYFDTSVDGGVVKVTYINSADGDTSYFDPHFTGNKRVRYVGVNTPEMSDTRPEWLNAAHNAKNFTDNILTNATTIYVQHDKAAGWQDTYERQLGLVWADGQLLNYLLVLNGHSANFYSDKDLFFVYEGVTLQYWFHRAEQHAKTNKLGIWALQSS